MTHGRATYRRAEMSFGFRQQLFQQKAKNEKRKSSRVCHCIDGQQQARQSILDRVAVHTTSVTMATESFLFTSESVNEGHPGECAYVWWEPVMVVEFGVDVSNRDMCVHWQSCYLGRSVLWLEHSMCVRMVLHSSWSCLLPSLLFRV